MKGWRRPWWRKKRWIAAGLVLALVGYVVSYGPANWFVWTYRDPWVARAVEVAYWPLDMLAQHGPAGIARGLRWYVGLWYDGRTGAT